MSKASRYARILNGPCREKEGAPRRDALSGDSSWDGGCLRLRFVERRKGDLTLRDPAPTGVEGTGGFIGHGRAEPATLMRVSTALTRRRNRWGRRRRGNPRAPEGIPLAAITIAFGKGALKEARLSRGGLVENSELALSTAELLREGDTFRSKGLALRSETSRLATAFNITAREGAE